MFPIVVFEELISIVLHLIQDGPAQRRRRSGGIQQRVQRGEPWLLLAALLPVVCDTRVDM